MRRLRLAAFRMAMGPLLLTAALALLSGCSKAMLANLMVKSPNHGRTFDPQRTTAEGVLDYLGVDEAIYVPVGPPDATLAAWVVHPKFEQAAADTPARGTILVLHGFGDGPLFMLGKARELAQHGYRTVVVALRGYGDSTGDHRTFGVVERRDLSQVVDVLEQRGLVQGRLGVLGMSYGASMAIELAGHDERIAAVVALAGFSSAREIAPTFARRFLPFLVAGSSDDRLQEIITLAGQRANFDPDDASAADAIARTRAAVLLVHGKLDAVVPYDHAQRLAEAAGPNAELLTLPAGGHFTVWLDPDRQVRDRMVGWFDKWLASESRQEAAGRHL